jgi:hypothetical protein
VDVIYQSFFQTNRYLHMRYYIISMCFNLSWTDILLKLLSCKSSWNGNPSFSPLFLFLMGLRIRIVSETYLGLCDSFKWKKSEECYRNKQCIRADNSKTKNQHLHTFACTYMFRNYVMLKNKGCLKLALATPKNAEIVNVIYQKMRKL